jgi:transposase
MMSTRLTRCKLLKQRFANSAHRQILFTDEKLFTIEQAYNSQNNRIWSKESPGTSAIISRTQKPASVMVWAGVTATGKTPLVFIDSGVKINQEVYRQMILKDVVHPWTKRHFGKIKWTLQQDSAPSHRAKATQQWCKQHFPNFISSEEWPPYSPDLNPLDYSIWSILEAKACAKSHASVDALKVSLRAAWEAISVETLRIVCDDFPRRLVACVKAKGGHFEFY